MSVETVDLYLALEALGPNVSPEAVALNLAPEALVLNFAMKALGLFKQMLKAMDLDKHQRL